MNNNQSSSKGILPQGISWRTVVLGLIAIGTFFAISSPHNDFVTMGGGMMESGSTRAVPPTSSASAPVWDSSVLNQEMKGRDMYYPYPTPDVPASDTREFLKTSYNASMNTRDVQGLTRKVETTVRGFSGRIDQESSSPKSGYLSFTVPQSKYDAFRTELESLVGKRFLTVSISSQNLLPQKVNIEEQQKRADESLAEYTSTRAKLVSAHTSTAASLQSQINTDNQTLITLRAQPQTAQTFAEIQNVSNDLASLQKRLASENATYKVQLSNADANIKNAQNWQKAIETQDEAFLDNVATVSGTVSIGWVSAWDIVQLYFPGYWIPAIFAGLTIVSFYFDRRRFAPSAISARV